MFDRSGGGVDLISWLNTDAGKAALAGAAGGLVRWLTLREKPRDGIMSLIVGTICAIYLGPLVVPILEPWVGPISPGNDASGFTSFIVGLGGIGVAGIVIDVMRAFQARLERGKLAAPRSPRAAGRPHYSSDPFAEGDDFHEGRYGGDDRHG